MENRRKVESFELNDPDQKARYEQVLNTYQIIREEFAYMKDSTPKITVWYIAEEE